MREIKFKVWDNVDYMSSPFTLHDLMFSEIEFTTDCHIRQYTGLKDKNGKEIYEGDICSRYHLRGEVAYHSERAMFILRDGFNEPLHQEIYGVEVIGNIYENPELLNQNK